MPFPTEAAAPAAKAADHAEAVVLAWRGHRLREEPERIPLVAGGYAAALVLWWVLFPEPLALLLPVAGLTLALGDFLFPASYRLTARGAHADCGLNRVYIAWEDVKRATHGAEGVYLSPFPRPSRLEAFRGVRLRFVGGNDDAVRDAVRRLWRKEAGKAA